MPQGQVCRHCRQPKHNIQTCEAYAKYMAVVEELDERSHQLDEARSQLQGCDLARVEDANIIKVQAAHISQLQAAVKRLAEQRDKLKALLGSVAVSSIGTGKGTSKHSDY